MKRKFAANPDYVEYQRLLVELHKMIVDGRGDSDEADSLRDKMDGPGDQLSPEEAERVGQLSCDLNSLQHDETYSVVSSPQQRADLARAMDSASSKGNWIEVLKLLRKRPSDADEAMIARLRGHAYLRLEEHYAALPILQYALTAFPRDARIRYEYLLALSSTAQWVTASDVASRFDVTTSTDLYWITQWVVVLKQIENDDDLPVFDWFVKCANKFDEALQLYQVSGSPDAFAFYMYFGFATVCCKVGRISEAFSAWRTAWMSEHDETGPVLLLALADELLTTAEAILVKAKAVGVAKEVPVPISEGEIRDGASKASTSRTLFEDPRNVVRFPTSLDWRPKRPLFLPYKTDFAEVYAQG